MRCYLAQSIFLSAIYNVLYISYSEKQWARIDNCVESKQMLAIDYQTLRLRIGHSVFYGNAAFHISVHISQIVCSAIKEEKQTDWKRWEEPKLCFSAPVILLWLRTTIHLQGIVGGYTSILLQLWWTPKRPLLITYGLYYRIWDQHWKFSFKKHSSRSKQNFRVSTDIKAQNEIGVTLLYAVQ